MMYREEEQGRIAITQPTHAWLSGQLARAWGNERFGEVTPWEEVCLGAEQHERQPHCMGASPHAQSRDGSSLQLSRDAQATACAALVTSRQMRPPTGTLCRTPSWSHSMAPDSTSATMGPTISGENARAVKHYLERERAFQEELLASLRSDPHYGPYATEEAVARNRRLVGVWDALSLAMCFGRMSPQSWEQVPTATSSTTLTLTTRDDDPSKLIVTPWPFRRQQVTLVYEGRYLTETFSNESMMREALKRAHWVILQTVLFPSETE